MGSLNKTNAQFYSRLPLTWSDGPIKILGMEVCVDNKNTAKINYQDLINKMDMVMGQWGKRDLTLIGKTEVCNSLILSQFWYKLQILPSPTKEIIQECKCKVSNFIWKACKDQLLPINTNN